MLNVRNVRRTVLAFRACFSAFSEIHKRFLLREQIVGEETKNISDVRDISFRHIILHARKTLECRQNLQSLFYCILKWLIISDIFLTTIFITNILLVIIMFGALPWQPSKCLRWVITQLQLQNKRQSRAYVKWAVI